MNDNPSNNPTPLDEELVAYLDGELDAESGRRIEALLATDPDVRRRLQSLERTWELLDELEAAPVGVPFTQTTMEMVALAARQDIEQSQAEAPRRRRRRLLIVVAALLAAVLVGFVAVAQFDPDRQLLQDLPILENLDEYRQVESIDFLHQLDNAGLFPKKKSNAEPPKVEPADDDAMLSARQRIEAMKLDEKEQLLQAEKGFQALSSAEKQRLRQLDKDLRDAPDAERLRTIMHDYCELLGTLHFSSRSELDDMTQSQRIAWAKKQIEEERKLKGEKPPGDADMKAVRSWMSDYVTRNEKSLVASLPPSRRSRVFESTNESLRHDALLWQWQARHPGKLPPKMTDEDLSKLRSQLTSDTRDRLEAKTPAEQWQLVLRWTRPAGRRFGESQRMRRPLPKEQDEELAKFFETELSPGQYDQLFSMPGEDIQLTLQQWYQAAHPRPPQGLGPRPNNGRYNRWPGGSDRPVPRTSTGTPPPVSPVRPSPKLP